MNFTNEALLSIIHKEWLDDCELIEDDSKP